MSGKTFGPWLAAELAARDMTQAELARRMETSTGAISSWVHNTRQPSPESCRRIAGELHVPLDEVLAMAGHRPMGNDGAWDTDIMAVAEMMKALPHRERAEIVAFARWRMERGGRGDGEDT